MVTRSPYPTRGGNQGQRRPRLPRVVVGAALAHRGHDVSGSLTEAELTLINMDDGTHQVSLTVHDGFDSSTADTADIIINNLAR